jgi:hypothetical protein
MPAPSGRRPAPATQPYLAYAICAVAWAVPGAGHLWLGRYQKGLTLLIVLPLMFACGLWFEGRIFPFQFDDLLVGLAAIADFGNGLPYFVARFVDPDHGRVTAITYEYGNTYMIVAGLLNMLSVLDAFDIAKGHK